MTGPSQERRLARLVAAQAVQTTRPSGRIRGAPPASRLDEDLAQMLEELDRGGSFPSLPPDCHDTHGRRSRCRRCREWRDEVDSWVEATIAAAPDDASKVLECFVGMVRLYEWGSSISEASLMRLAPYVERSLRILPPSKF